MAYDRDMEKLRGPSRPNQPPSSRLRRGIREKIIGVIDRHPIASTIASVVLLVGAPQLSEKVREAEKKDLAKISRSIRDFTDETQVSFNIWQKDKEFFQDQIAEIINELEASKEYRTIAGYHEDNNDDDNAKKYFQLAAAKAYGEKDPYSAADYYEKAGDRELAKKYWLEIADKESSTNEEDAARYYEKAEEFEKAQEARLRYAEKLFSEWKNSGSYYNQSVEAYRRAGLTPEQIDAKFAEQNKLNQQQEETEIEILTKIEPKNLKTEDYIKIANFYDRQEKTELAKTYWLKAAEKYLEPNRLPEAWEFELTDFYVKAGLDEKDISLRFAQVYESMRSWAKAALKYDNGDDKENAKRCWIKEAEISAKQESFDYAARAYGNGDDQTKANEYFLLAAKQKEEFGKKLEDNDYLYKAAEFYESGGDSNKAKELFQQVAEKAYREGNFSLAARAYFELKNHEKRKECLIKVAKQTIAETKWDDGKERTLSDRTYNATKTLKKTGMDEEEIRSIMAETLEANQYYREAAWYHKDEDKKSSSQKI